jgi:translation initiation factor IF-1
MDEKKKNLLKLQGKVKEVLPGSKFRVEIDLQSRTHEVIGHISGRMRMNYIRLQIGDLVDVEISPYDLTKGRITYRHNK